MTKERTHFSVSPRLAPLLSAGYRSSEKALKELVDNAWDADAEKVTVTLPEAMSDAPLVVADDGTGMTPDEVREVYLAVADGRRNRQGGSSTQKRRKLKGRKGIGKFAGLMVAAEMQLETTARGKRTTLTLGLADLHAAVARNEDLEAVDLGLTVVDAPKSQHGTTVTLSGLNRKLGLPSREKLAQLVVREYGRAQDFDVVIDDVKVGVADIAGKTHEITFDVPGVGPAIGTFTISEKPVKNAGIVFTVGGKVVGDPTFLGLDRDPELPSKLAGNIYGEVEIEGLHDHVTADWGSFVENSEGFQNAQEQLRRLVKGGLEETHKMEVQLAKARHQKEIKRRLAELPENRRKLAQEAVEKIFKKFPGERDDRIETILSVTFDAFEVDDYWEVIKAIDASTNADVATVASVLADFGLVDMAVTAQQAQRRIRVLDSLSVLADDSATLEKQVHAVVEANPWILGNEYNVLRSNQTLKNTLGDLVDKPSEDERPDLFLGSLPGGRHVLVEFKRPSHPISRDDEAQAEKYRDQLSKKYPDIDVVIVGRERAQKVDPQYEKPRLRVVTWSHLISAARLEIAWLLEHLGTDARRHY